MSSLGYAVFRARVARHTPIQRPDEVFGKRFIELQTRVRSLEGEVSNIADQLATANEQLATANERLKATEAAKLELVKYLKIEEGVDPTPRFTIKNIVKEVARTYDMTSEEILGNCRSQELIEPRHIAMYLAKIITRKSLPQIGQLMDRDHTTILHAVRKIGSMRKYDAVLDQTIARIERSVRIKYGVGQSP